ncbi:MAG: acetyl-CoA acetyltransferase [Gordonia polyisoprenivorans]|nr:acetyl-CoA acetyltransferase [Gordonia polyisoprenivorans]
MKRSTPVIVGVGQYTLREPRPGFPEDPAALAIEAVRRAFADAGIAESHTERVEAFHTINMLSWRYRPDAAHEICTRLGISPRICVETSVGGEQPVAVIDDLSDQIARGELDFAVVSGAEGQYSLSSAKRSGTPVPWPVKPAQSSRPADHVKAIVHPEAWRHGLRFPIQVYPLFENAYRAAKHQTFAAAQAESGALWAEMSSVAAQNPHAWYREPLSAEQIVTPGPTNRWIFYPYPKHLNAAPNVNQSAAVVLMSSSLADEFAIPESHRVHPISAARGREIADPIRRPSFSRSRAMEATLDHALRTATQAGELPELLEIYSCFPVVPKLARDHLGLPAHRELTVTGGLSFFGGPGNNYMLHGVADLVARLRQSPEPSTALAYGQGEFVTKHAALVLSSAAPATEYQAGTEPIAEQRAIDAAVVNDVESAPDGPSVIETFTAFQEGDGWIGLVVGRLEADGRRFVARTDPTDTRTMAGLLSPDLEAVGRPGTVTPGERFNEFVLR